MTEGGWYLAQSATRRSSAHLDPWLCVPTLRWVCLFASLAVLVGWWIQISGVSLPLTLLRSGSARSRPAVPRRKGGLPLQRGVAGGVPVGGAAGEDSRGLRPQRGGECVGSAL